MLVFLSPKAHCSPIPQKVMSMWDVFQRMPGTGFLAFRRLISRVGWRHLNKELRNSTVLLLIFFTKNWELVLCLSPMANVCRILSSLVNICWKNWWMSGLFLSLGGITNTSITKGSQLCGHRGLCVFLLWAGTGLIATIEDVTCYGLNSVP